jgi:hypothetical protein
MAWSGRAPASSAQLWMREVSFTRRCTRPCPRPRQSRPKRASDLDLKVGVVDDAVEDGVGERGLADEVVPCFHGELTGDERRAAAALLVRWRHEAEKVCGAAIPSADGGPAELRGAAYFSSAHDPGRVKTPKGRSQIGTVFPGPIKFYPSWECSPHHSRSGGRSFCVLRAPQSFYTANTHFFRGMVRCTKWFVAYKPRDMAFMACCQRSIG